MKKFFILIICIIIIPFSYKIHDIYKEAKIEKKLQEAAELRNSEEYKAKQAAKEAAEREERKQFIETLSNKYPYEGLQEEYINYTTLGPADKSEKSLDFDKKKASHRSTKYTWYTSSGKVRAIASVIYWDYKTDREVPGYVRSFTTYFEEGE